MKCKIRTQKVSEIKMRTHSEAKTVLAPPFHAAMVDIAYGFEGKPFEGTRKELKVYAFVIVCLLSGACNILVMEGCETQDVVALIEIDMECLETSTIHRQWNTVKSSEAFFHELKRCPCSGSGLIGNQDCDLNC